MQILSFFSSSKVKTPVQRNSVFNFNLQLNIVTFNSKLVDKNHQLIIRRKKISFSVLKMLKMILNPTFSHRLDHRVKQGRIQKHLVVGIQLQ